MHSLLLRTRLGLRPALLAALLICAPIAAGAVHAGESVKLTEIIVSHLPKPDSADYAALKAAAGGGAGEALDMTQSEMWSVPEDRLPELEKAASALGVGIRKLDSTWNHTLAPMAPDAAMTAEQKSMMHANMASKAAMGMSMMELPAAEVLEYALTKGMNAETGGAPAAEVVIPLSKTLTVKAIRHGIEKTDDGYIWHGTVADSGEPATLMWWPRGRLTGQITYQGHIFAIRNIGGGMHGVVEMAPKGLPPEHAPMGEAMKKKMNMKEDPLVTKGDASMLRAKPESKRPDRNDTRDLEDAPLKSEPDARRLREPITAPERSDATPESGSKTPVEITLLVAYTRHAASHYTDIRKDLIELAVADTNQSFRRSGIANVRLKLVHAYQTGYAEKGTHFDHVFQFADKGDGKMEEVHALRDKHKADVALLIVHDPHGCGLAAGVAPKADRAFAVVHHACAAVSYSLAHEIGHILGARHDIGLDDSKDPFPFGHGFVMGREWRTMMSYEESCGGCPRLPIWSNPKIVIRGVPAGDEFANNALVIANEAARVASFR